MGMTYIPFVEQTLGVKVPPLMPKQETKEIIDFLWTLTFDQAADLIGGLISSTHPERNGRGAARWRGPTWSRRGLPRRPGREAATHASKLVSTGRELVVQAAPTKNESHSHMPGGTRP
jgi:hypothetical protein